MNLLLIAVAVMIGIVQTQPQPPSASIEGIVVKLGTGEALADASVQLNLDIPPEQQLVVPPPSRDRLQRKTRADSSGRFIFENVPPGRYRLIATYEEAGYVPSEFGQRSPTGEGIPFDVGDGQKMTGIQLALSPTGAISGRIYDRDGEPLGKAQVLALRAVYKSGRRTMTIVQSVESDDRGEYRLYWLAPGRYYVGVMPDVGELPLNLSIVRVTPPSRFGTFEQGLNPVVRKRKLRTGEIVEEMSLPVYYPNTVDMNAAAAVSVPAGATVGGVDIAAGTGVITPHHIRGRVFDQKTGQPVAGAILSALPHTQGPFFATPRAQSNADGTFDMAGVAPSSYQISAGAHSESRSLDGIANVEIADRDIENLPIVVTSGFKLPARFVMDGTGRSANGPGSFPRVSLSRISNVLDVPSGFTSFNPPANADGSFTMEGVPSGDFRVTVQRLPADAYVKSIRMGSADVLNEGIHISSPPEAVLEIVIGANAGRIEGAIVNSRNDPLPNRTVVLVPDVRFRQRSDLYKVVTTDSAGVFHMQGITPGDYKLFAWDNVETGSWENPDFIQAYENAGRPLHISEGSRENLQLPVIP
jgi:hypothetical protein